MNAGGSGQSLFYTSKKEGFFLDLQVISSLP